MNTCTLVDGEGAGENEHSALMYATYGAAVYFASTLEYGLINVLATAEVIEAKLAGRVIPDDPWERRCQSKQTMGVFLGEVKKTHLPSASSLANELDQALKRRNYLTHHFWRERIDDSYSTTGRNKLIGELEADRKLFENTDQQLHMMVMEPLMCKVGVTKEMRDAMLRRAEHEAENRYED
ncbi:hypothetical protein ACIBKZ_10235 [Streptomyces sp. NPDC050421]|uniref:hypothetical protein n=1 Tax=Streptomyces sp. NPDC050421 TaxID=3365613 RepID=UPI0037AD758F